MKMDVLQFKYGDKLHLHFKLFTALKYQQVIKFTLFYPYVHSIISENTCPLEEIEKEELVENKVDEDDFDAVLKEEDESIGESLCYVARYLLI